MANHDCPCSQACMQPTMQAHLQEPEYMALVVLSMALNMQIRHTRFRQMVPVAAAAPGGRLALINADLPTGAASTACGAAVTGFGSAVAIADAIRTRSNCTLVPGGKDFVWARCSGWAVRSRKGCHPVYFADSGTSSHRNHCRLTQWTLA